MKIQQNAVNVLERTSAYLQAGMIKKPPVWYDVVAATPPSKKFTREPKFINPSTNKRTVEFKPLKDYLNRTTGLYKTRANSIDKKNAVSSLYKIPKLTYIEDKLRKLFYEQHPWELTRPKIVMENHGEVTYDWSRLLQLGKPLDGESVVQRTLFLLKTKEHRKLIDAYNQARFEFYRLRMAEEIQEQVAQEESEMFGAVFGSTTIEFGIEKEQEMIDSWKVEAIKETEINEAKRSKESVSWKTDSLEGKEDEFNTGDILEAEPETTN
ncbi:hypothetical protein TBLA_0B05960 [Henningerozyma blattae CBS 6284]|uniref:37S ribosomal protein S25, mitochondrial n=1 Tax=Henningerozyma blattae (strain ATCC 34711 / CBS 6284 / DSM 70876 / NBRC 10599 / NRRL Y-10934 / UCD 77-7) TaxID=1071380 RepID=I2GZ70_HENB6|nr:hypothetical protein TBLA_0B05960 [Tetrapisispora blattae CBS 6284]CCH59422.1 hypothetical protein TBLA_0B05960 [Tetrapisispora blattae CBS 6284]